MLLVVVLSVIVAVLATVVIWYGVEEIRTRRTLSRRRVVVNLVDDQAVTGVLWLTHRRLVVLRSASLVQPGREPVRMDGDVVIERDRINWVQIVGS